MRKVSIIDLGVSNVFSTSGLFSKIGYKTEIIKKGKPSSQSLSEIFEDIAMLIPMARGESEEVIDIKDVIDTYKKEKEEDRDIEMRKIYENKLKELRDNIQSLSFGSSEKK